LKKESTKRRKKEDREEGRCSRPFHPAKTVGRGRAKSQEKKGGEGKVQSISTGPRRGAGKEKEGEKRRK